MTSAFSKAAKLAAALAAINTPRSVAALWYRNDLDHVDGLTIDPMARLIGGLINKFRVPGQLPTVEESRQQLANLSKLLDAPAPDLAGTEDRTIPAEPAPVPVRIYTPQDGGDTPRGVLAYFHGGGWIQGSIETHDGICRRLAAWSGCVVVSVEYRLAPEHKFPAGLNDCYAVYRWLLDHAGEIGGDPARVAVGGDSAGGNLAAAICYMAEKDGIRMPAHQVLLYPGLDFRMATHSHESLAETYMLSKMRMDWYTGLYLNSDDEKSDPRASPLQAGDFSGWPTATVATAGFDPLRDEGKEYADALTAAGVAADYRCFEGMFHAFCSMPKVFPQADEALRFCADGLKRALG
jgi:acetyl esterase